MDKEKNTAVPGALALVGSYLLGHYDLRAREAVKREIDELLGGMSMTFEPREENLSYEVIQERLSRLNEKEAVRKDKGVYYTPRDIVTFILNNGVRLSCGTPEEGRMGIAAPEDIPYQSFCYDKTVYDPTCGTGVFLLAALEMKWDLLERNGVKMTPGKIRKVAATINGNDVNPDSIGITKLRLLLCALHRYGTAGIRNLGAVIRDCFTAFDFVTARPDGRRRYDIIVGNPPYVEDSKSESAPARKYGNIYANVLENAALCLKRGGVMGFVIPLSYVATPRMNGIREELSRHVPEQYILSFSDRPDCLFTSVHQKLCILFGRNSRGVRRIFTGNYQYWYREEREKLFRSIEIVQNAFGTEKCIPKLGTETDAAIYAKLMAPRTTLADLLGGGGEPLFVNMRAAFWIKAFLHEHKGGEYRALACGSKERRNFCMCLLNSSLFWWYWICVSDCWHITSKELSGFKVPEVSSFGETDRLAVALERRLEETKRYVGTKQTEYEYKHRECVEEIRRIDDHVNALYGLDARESGYVKDFAYRYRISGGADDGRD